MLCQWACVQVDDAFACSDREAVEMAAHLLRCDGLFVGSSAAVNCVGAVKAARALGPGRTVVTVRACWSWLCRVHALASKAADKKLAHSQERGNAKWIRHARACLI